MQPKAVPNDAEEFNWRSNSLEQWIRSAVIVSVLEFHHVGEKDTEITRLTAGG
jgi:hypothetical protein